MVKKQQICLWVCVSRIWRQTETRREEGRDKDKCYVSLCNKRQRAFFALLICHLAKERTLRSNHTPANQQYNLFGHLKAFWCPCSTIMQTGTERHQVLCWLTERKAVLENGCRTRNLFFFFFWKPRPECINRDETKTLRGWDQARTESSPDKTRGNTTWLICSKYSPNVSGWGMVPSISLQDLQCLFSFERCFGDMFFVVYVPKCYYKRFSKHFLPGLHLQSGRDGWQPLTH